MKKKQLKKLTLNKSVISKLTDSEQDGVKGGAAEVTTSFGGCTGFLCCNQPMPDCTSNELYSCNYGYTASQGTICTGLGYC